MKALFWLVVAIVTPFAVAGAQEHSWTLLTQTAGGKVNITRDLTEGECEYARNRVLGLPATDEERAAVKAAQEARSASWRSFLEDNNCTQSGTTSLMSYKDDSGGCWLGADLGATSWGSISFHDIRLAECF